MSDSSSHPDHSLPGAALSRRGFIAGSTALATVMALPPARAVDTTPAAGDDGISDVMATVVDFDGPHQSGIATGAQSGCNMIGFTIRNGVGKKQIKNLMTLWTEDARRLTAGQAPLGSLEPEMAKAPASLTITCGLGPRFFDVIGKADQRPSWLAPLPAFSKDKLDPQWGQTDIAVQVCANDPLTLAFATRHMIRSAVDYVAVAWMQTGFLPPDGAREAGGTPRNLFGVKDGTVNPGSEDDYDNIVWIDEGPAWARGGSCMVVRRIEMDLDGWEKLDRDSREVVFGRKLSSGAPLTGTAEFDTPDFKKVDALGLPVIDPHSHMARSHNPDDKPFQKLRRRAYSYDLPPNPASEALSNSGLIFICFQKDPLRQFVEIQQRLNAADRLNQWITHVGSAVYVCPPGTSADGTRDRYWAQRLIEG